MDMIWMVGAYVWRIGNRTVPSHQHLQTYTLQNLPLGTSHCTQHDSWIKFGPTSRLSFPALTTCSHYVHEAFNSATPSQTCTKLLLQFAVFGLGALGILGTSFCLILGHITCCILIFLSLLVCTPEPVPLDTSQNARCLIEEEMTRWRRYRPHRRPRSLPSRQFSFPPPSHQHP